MIITPEALESLRPFSDNLEVLVGDGREFIFLPGLKVTVNSTVRILDGLLCPSELHGYKTRLFLSERVPEKVQNWSQFTMFGRVWNTWSWQHVEATLPLPQMLRAHLDALR